MNRTGGRMGKVSGSIYEDCDCPFDYEYTCPACGHTRITNHCPHDAVQNPCPRCGWLDPGQVSPLQALGLREVPREG